MTIAITGHRPDKIGAGEYMGGVISDKIKITLFDLIDKHKPDKGISGMALGVDMLWAHCLFHKNIPFIAAVPFIGQESKWSSTAQSYYKTMLSCSSEIVVVSEGGYAPYKMQKRNEWMVDKSDLLIGVWDGSKGGTANCIDYARRNKKELIIINPQTL